MGTLRASLKFPSFLRRVTSARINSIPSGDPEQDKRYREGTDWTIGWEESHASYSLGWVGGGVRKFASFALSSFGSFVLNTLGGALMTANKTQTESIQ